MQTSEMFLFLYIIWKWVNVPLKKKKDQEKWQERERENLTIYSLLETKYCFNIKFSNICPARGPHCSWISLKQEISILRRDVLCKKNVNFWTPGSKRRYRSKLDKYKGDVQKNFTTTVYQTSKWVKKSIREREKDTTKVFSDGENKFNGL